MTVGNSLGISRRRFITRSAIVAGGATLVGAMGFAPDADATPSNDHHSTSGLAPLDPSIEHLRKEYRGRAEEIFRELGTVLGDKSGEPVKSTPPVLRGKALEDPGSTRRHLAAMCRRLLERALMNGCDNSVLFRLSVHLRRWKSVAPADDCHLAAAMRAWDNVQKVYLLDEGSYAPARPTILFVHGSGIGPFPVFNALFRDLRRDYNIAFFLYDHLDPIADIASRLNRSWATFHQEHRPAGPLRIVSLSYGTSVFRHAVLMDKEDLWQGSALVEIAPVVLGSKYLQWLNAAPGEMFFLQLAVPNLKNWANGVDGKKPPQRIIWAPQGIAAFDKVIRARLSLIPERDEHLSSNARRQLKNLLGEGKFLVIKGAKHDPAPGLEEVVSQTRQFLESCGRPAAPAAG